MQKTFTKFLILTIAFTFALSVNYLFAAWTGPTQNPPSGNTETPVHVGTTDQVKDGGLSLNGLSVFGGGYFQGNVGIGNVSPGTTTKLSINNGDDEVKFTSGGNIIMGNERQLHGKATSGIANVLIGMSDEDKVTIAYDGNDTVIGERGGNVGIGTTEPEAKLHIGGTSGTDGIMFPDGTLQTTASPLVQGGKINVGTSEAVQTVTFSTSYSSVPVVTATSGSNTGGRSSGAHLHHVEVYDITTTGFKVWREGHDGSRSGFISWIAVGN